MEIKAGANIGGLHIMKVKDNYAYYTRNVTRTVRRWVYGEEQLDMKTESRPGKIRLDVLEALRKSE